MHMMSFLGTKPTLHQICLDLCEQYKINYIHQHHLITKMPLRLFSGSNLGSSRVGSETFDQGRPNIY